MFTYLQENKFLSENQSGFRRNYSCSSQLIAIAHGIYKSFDANPSLETRDVFLDISKAFDKVWHEMVFVQIKMLQCGRGFIKYLTKLSTKS